jgi:hypothetical protein
MKIRLKKIHNREYSSLILFFRIRRSSIKKRKRLAPIEISCILSTFTGYGFSV